MALERGELRVYKNDIQLNQGNEYSEMIIDLIDAVTIIGAASKEIDGMDEVRDKVTDLLDFLKLHKEKIEESYCHD